MAAVAAGGWYVFLRDDSPDEFDIDTAVEGAGDDDTTDSTDGDDGSGADGDVAGTWTVDPGAGADAGGPSAGLRVDEELASIGAATAVGRTPESTGR